MKLKARLFDLFKIFIGILIISPLIISIIVSFMPKADILTEPFKLTLAHATFQNYIESFVYLNLGTYMKNTFVMLVICLPCQLFTSLLAAYGFSHFEFPFKETLFTILLAVMMIPGESIMISVFKMMVGWHLVDTYAALTLNSLISVGAVFMFRQYMKSIPKELSEAASIDGCGRMTYFFRILVPLCKTMIVTFSLRAFVGIYNSYMWPFLVTTKDSMRTITTGVALISTKSHDGLTLAAASITAIIPMIVYAFGMDQIVAGMTAGAVKN